MLSKLLFLFLTGHPNASLILSRLWTLNGDLLVSGLLEMYKKDANTLSRILDIAQDLRVSNQHRKYLFSSYNNNVYM
jgi:CCR4-NOT transcription complex subunit 1